MLSNLPFSQDSAFTHNSSGNCTVLRLANFLSPLQAAPQLSPCARGDHLVIFVQSKLQGDPAKSQIRNRKRRQDAQPRTSHRTGPNAHQYHCSSSKQRGNCEC